MRMYELKRKIDGKKKFETVAMVDLDDVSVVEVRRWQGTTGTPEDPLALGPALAGFKVRTKMGAVVDFEGRAEDVDSMLGSFVAALTGVGAKPRPQRLFMFEFAGAQGIIDLDAVVSVHVDAPKSGTYTMHALMSTGDITTWFMSEEHLVDFCAQLLEWRAP